MLLVDIKVAVGVEQLRGTLRLCLSVPNGLRAGSRCGKAGPQQHGFHDAEDRGIPADPEYQRENRNGR